MSAPVLIGGGILFIIISILISYKAIPGVNDVITDKIPGLAKLLDKIPIDHIGALAKRIADEAAAAAAAKASAAAAAASAVSAAVDTVDDTDDEDTDDEDTDDEDTDDEDDDDPPEIKFKPVVKTRAVTTPAVTTPAVKAMTSTLSAAAANPMIAKPANGWNSKTCYGIATTPALKKSGWCRTPSGKHDKADSHYADACCQPAQSDLGYMWVQGTVPANTPLHNPAAGTEILGTIKPPQSAATGDINSLKFNPRMSYDGCNTATKKCSNDSYSRFCHHLKNRGVCNNAAVKEVYNTKWCRGGCN